MAAAQPMLIARPQRSQGKFFYLLLAQVSLLVLFPFLDKPGLPTVIFRLLGAITLLSGVYAVSDRRSHCVTATVLAVSAGALHSFFVLHPSSIIAVPTLLVTIVFLTYTLVLLLQAVFRHDTVTADTIYGALSVYLLMALTWGAAYLLLSTLQPGALMMDAGRHPNHTIDWFDCMFYSFVTLTTLGYGDIVPMSAHARSLSILEAVTGTMYVAVLVARLVGLYSVVKSAAPLETTS